jgi:tRNA threonylcarbamoyladenosine biosynthesis protein TsaE
MKIQFTYEERANVVKKFLLPLANTYRIFTFEGPLGAGKTTLIKEFLRQNGVTSLVTSPTFGYFNTYQGNNRTFYHFDVYRISSVDEFIHAGFEEYLHQPDAIVLIEWPAIIAPLLKDPRIASKTCSLTFSYDPSAPQRRFLEFSYPIPTKT